MFRLVGSVVGLVLAAFLVYVAVWCVISPAAAVSLRDTAGAAGASFFGWLGHRLGAVWTSWTNK
jgi:hypothetical protein